MIYTQTLSVTFDPITEAEEIKAFVRDNPDWDMIPSTGGVSFVMNKTVWSWEEAALDIQNQNRDEAAKR